MARVCNADDDATAALPQRMVATERGFVAAKAKGGVCDGFSSAVGAAAVLGAPVYVNTANRLKECQYCE